MPAKRFAGFIVCVGLAMPCVGSETVYLKNGFILEVKSHTVQGDAIIVDTRTGTLEFPEQDVSRIEAIAESPAVRQLGAAKTPSELLKGAANLQGIEPELVQSVAMIESGLHQNVISSKGAIGLMQLMPLTAAELKAKASDADSNALGGAKYLRELLARYGGNYALALAAYNAGPGAVAKYRGVPPYAETVNYVMKVLREYQQEKSKADPQATKNDRVRQRRPNTPSAIN